MAQQQRIECGECKRVVYVQSESSLLNDGWCKWVLSLSNEDGWRCNECGERGEKVTYDQRVEEAYDQETCSEFLVLAQQLFGEGRIAHPVLARAMSAVTYLETALRTSGQYAWGHMLQGSPAEPENYEAM